MGISEHVTQWVIEAAEQRRVPDRALRWGIRRLLAQRIADATRRGQYGATLGEAMRKLPVAIEAEAANAQHYEVPQAFFTQMLGPRLKYSACIFEPGEGTDALAAAEERTLALTCERGQLEDGMRVLELGCGWGSLSLWIAEHYPKSEVLAVSNSSSQREGILAKARERGFDNLAVITQDVAHLELDRRFDRVFSIEMFEHMRNWPVLFGRIARWLEPDGALFLHYFCHREFGYFYEDEGAGDWMSRNFFSGGVMPSENLPFYFEDDLCVDERWRVGGLHYARTLEAWLDTLDANEAAALEALARPDGSAARELQKWRMFVMACAELFAHDEGRSWFVAHVRLKPRAHAVA